MVSHTLTSFGGDKHCESGDIMVLLCHVISQDSVSKLSNSMDRSLSRLVTTLPSLVVIGTVVVKI